MSMVVITALIMAMIAIMAITNFITLTMAIIINCNMVVVSHGNGRDYGRQ